MEQESTRREPKKTRSIEVRVSEEEREAFLERCQREQQPASAVLREAMAQYARTGRAALHHRSRFMTHAIAASVLAVSFALQSTPFQAGQDAPYGLTEFELFDVNGNDVLTEREYRQAFSASRVFSEPGHALLQAQYHGMIAGSFYGVGYSGPMPQFERSYAEISAECWNAIDREMSAGLAVWFHAMDQDGDRRVSVEEFSEAKLQRALRTFESLDRNADQRLSVEDLRRLSDRADAGEPAQAPPPSAGAPQTFRDAEPDFLRICARDFEALPVVSRPAPLASPPDPDTVFSEHYAPYDTNGDGALTFAEFSRAMDPTY